MGGSPPQPSNVDVEQGTLALTDGSSLSATGTITITDIAYAVPADGSNAVKDNSATLSIDSTSVLQQGAATLSGYGDNAAELHGVTISGSTISGYSSGLSATDSVASTHTISNASFGIDSTQAGTSKEDSNGYTLNNLTLTGTGALANTTLGENVTVSGSYTLGSAVTVTNTVTNSGSITVDADSTIIGIGRMENTNGTYTVFSGGSYTGWTSLGTGNFRVHGVLVSDIDGASVNTRTNGSVTITLSDASIFDWDSEWGYDSWDAPAAGLDYNTSPRRSNFIVVSTSSSGGGWWGGSTTTSTTYRYDQIVNEGSEGIYVINLESDAGSSSYGVYGIAEGAAEDTSATSPIDIWINDEGSNWRTYIAGSASAEYYGDTHLQITAELTNATTIIGASQEAVQHGNSYLTIAEGTYNSSSDLIVAGSVSAQHDGDSLLHITGGTYGTVYGGSYDSYTTGDTRVMVDGGTVVTIYGGDYSESATTHTGNATIELNGGTVTNVYAAGGGDNQNLLSGNAHVKLYADEAGTMATTFGTNAVLDGGLASITGGGHSALAIAEAGTYGLEDVTIDNFSHMELVEGAQVDVNIARFNNANDLIITGPGVVTLHGNSGQQKTHDLYLEGGATLQLEVATYQDVFNQPPTSLPAIYVAKGSTLETTGYPNTNTNDIGVRLFLEGDGTDGQGALYKGNSEGSGGTASNKVEFCEITLTGHASVGAGSEEAGSSAIYMIPLRNTYYAATLDLKNDAPTERGYIFTKQGSGTFGVFNTDIEGGTINVAEGTFYTNVSSSGGNTDMVLHEGTTLEFGPTVGYLPNLGEEVNGTAQAADHNGFAIESLSGAGSVDTGTAGWLYINMDQGYTDFADDFGTTPLIDENGEQQLFYNDKGYEYAVYSGEITGSGQVSKSGSGTQYFTGSDSTYTGDTIAEGGILYLTGTSTATDFGKANKGDDGKLKATTTVTEGVAGTGHMQWAGGKVYLGDGTRIYNASPSETNTGTIILGVEGGDELEPDAAGNLVYNEATYSGCLATTGSMTKEGKGTLTFDQFGRFDEGIFIEEGTLNLCGWADADDYNITQNAGSTLMLSYDGSYGEDATETITSTLEVTGTGDVHWSTDPLVRTTSRTAALISDIGESKELEILGKITDDINSEDGVTSPSGNVLHSGEGTLTLSGANDYKGGTTISNGTVIVRNSTGLGDTANGADANLVLTANAELIIADTVLRDEDTLAETGRAETEITLAAVKEGTHAGNDIRGEVHIGTGAEGEMASRLNMTGDGYYASRTELAENSTLVFCGEDSGNWDGIDNATKPAGTTEMVGAGILAGSGTIAVSDAGGKETEVRFESTSGSGFTGDVVVEGDKAHLHIASGKLVGGNYSISGYGAMLEARESDIVVQNQQTVHLRSMGDADSDPQSTACLAANRVQIDAGGTLSTARAATEFAYNELELEDVMNTEPTANLQGYSASSARNYRFIANYTAEDGYEHYFDPYNAINHYTAATLDTVGGLTMKSGSIYEVSGTNTGLSGTQLTLDVSGSDERILLRGGTAFTDYIDTLAAAGTDDTIPTKQWVLFSDVGSFTAINSVANMTCSLLEGQLENQIYVGRANEFVVASGADGQTAELADNILLVYDAGAQVLYLDRKPNIYPEDPDAVPEPSTATLSLLALTALMARRRRK